MRESFENICIDVTKTAKKIPQNCYKAKGRYKIIDQGKDIVSGFWNSQDGLANTPPYIVFGDHTRVLKYIDEPCFIGADGVKLLKVFNPNFAAKYVYYALLSDPIESCGYSRHFKYLKEKKFRCVDLQKQMEIVRTFDNVQYLISNAHNREVILDELIKSRFIEMFGDCIENTKGWNLIHLGDIATVGSSRRVFVEDLKDEGIPFFRGTEIGALAEGQSITPELFITEKHYHELCEATGKPQIGDLLMPSICPDGRIWLVNTEQPFYFKDGRVLWVHSLDNRYNPVFLLYMLKNRIISDYSRIASGTTFAELKIFELKKCLVFDVPITQQNVFASFIKQADKSKLVIKESLKALEELRASLMQKYFFN